MRKTISNSSATTFRRCPREYQHAYVARRRPRKKAPALAIGTLMHIGLEGWWRARPESRLRDAIAAVIAAPKGELTGYDVAMVECLLAGYSVAWTDQPFECIEAEKKFRVPLYGAWDSVGAIDVIARHTDGSIHLVEHKTTTQDIAQGSSYWRHIVTLDSQVSTYMGAAAALGLHPKGMVYDVLRKPNLKPYKATPTQDRKYTKPTKASPTPKLYANMHETDESVEAYRERLIAEISSNPEKYFRRAPIFRLERELAEHKTDMAGTAMTIDLVRSWGSDMPRSTASCERYGRLCDYHDVCSGTSSIDDDSVFRTSEHQHEELGEV